MWPNAGPGSVPRREAAIYETVTFREWTELRTKRKESHFREAPRQELHIRSFPALRTLFRVCFKKRFLSRSEYLMTLYPSCSTHLLAVRGSMSCAISLTSASDQDHARLPHLVPGFPQRDHPRLNCNKQLVESALRSGCSYSV